MVEDVVAGEPDSPPPLRVAHLIHSLAHGGAESVLVELAGVAATAGLELTVVALSPATRSTHADALRDRGVPVVELDLPRWDPRAVPQAVAALRAFGPQLVHTHLKHADIVGGVAGPVLGVPVVSTLHVVEDAPAGAVGRFKRSAGLAVRRRAAARTIALSSAQHRWYQELTGSADRVVVLPNGVADPGIPDPAESRRVRAELGVRAGQPLVVTASLMRPEKGHRLLLDAVSRLPADVHPFVALAGDGELRGELQARVDADPALRQRVHLLGYRGDVPRLLGAADLVLHPSLADALPTTVMQGLAVGVPVLATDVGGIPDIVGDAAGVLVPTDPDALAAALTRLLADDVSRARMGAAGRARFLDRFEAVAWAGRLRALYETVLAGTDRRPRRPLVR